MASTVTELIRRRMMGSKSILPQGYTELEYIENTNKAMFTISVSLPFSVEIDFAPNLKNVYGYYAVTFGTNSHFQAGFKSDGTAYIGNQGSTAVFFRDGVKSKITATVTPTATTTSYYVDGVNTGLSRDSNTSEWSLFAAGMGGIFYADGKMYSFRLWKDGELIFDLKPCINPSGVYGMYDIINNVFYGSITSTPFTGQ